MAPISPGGPAPRPRKVKKTPTTKNYRYEPFTKRIARLKIDPVHAVGKKPVRDTDNDLSTSYFRTALDEWSTLNLSETFTTFFTTVNPLCESLPQLLHHADTIFNALVQHIEKQDPLALEPLLSLLAHLAHDLGQRFDHCFETTVKLVAKFAASQDDADVVEWCFTCLAWMLKYLSRLLVQDLRPMLDIMIPYLSSRKDHIVRFSAESLAFLIRKAAVLYQKRKEPLTLALRHLAGCLVSCNDQPTQSSLRHGVMDLCVESARGIDLHLHSSAQSLVICLLGIADSSVEHEVVLSTVSGVLIGIIHETRVSHSTPIIDAVLEVCRRATTSPDNSQVVWYLRLLHVLVGTRKGSRISSWSPIIDIYLLLIQHVEKTAEGDPEIRRRMIVITTEILQFAPMDQLLPYVERLIDMSMAHLTPATFFAFSTSCAELGKERFMDLVLPRLQRYISDKWCEDEVSLHYFLERLQRNCTTSNRPGVRQSITCPPRLDDLVAAEFGTQSAQGLSMSPELLAGRLHLVKNMVRSTQRSNPEESLKVFKALVAAALQSSDGASDLQRRICLGWGFSSLLDLHAETSQDVSDLLPLIFQSSPANFRIPAFLTACTDLLGRMSVVDTMQGLDWGPIKHILLQNFLSISVELKKFSLILLASLELGEIAMEFKKAIELMLEILDTPYTPAHARNIAMLLRRLPQRQSALLSDTTLQDAIPLFCLGLLQSYHDKTRQEVCKVLAEMAATASTEECIVSTVIQWLQTPSPLSRIESRREESKARPTAYECSILTQTESLCDQILGDFLRARESFMILVEEAHKLEISRIPEDGRYLALQLLSSIPALAERRSRLIVPIFLSAPMTRAQMQSPPSSDTSVSSHTLSPEVDDHEWSFIDRKAFLSLLGKFNNPRVLYRSSDVHEKLLGLLSNGSTDIRKLALEALLTWKDPIVASHQKTLMQVAEDEKTAVDFGTLLSTEEVEGALKSSDRMTVLPILVRLILGLMVGRSGTAGSPEARRKAFLRALFRLNEGEFCMFLQIAMGDLGDVKASDLRPQETLCGRVNSPNDQQYGFLRLLLSTLEIFGSRFAPYGTQVVDAVVSLTVNSSQNTHQPLDPNPQSAMSRNIRRTGIQCLVLLFDHCPAIEWSQYLPLLFARVVSPRLALFATETAQGVSGLLRLFAAFTRSHESIHFIRGYDSRLSQALWDSLVTPSTRTEVKVFILDSIVMPWIDLAEDDTTVGPNVASGDLEIETGGLLIALTTLLEQTPPKEVLALVTTILPRIAKFAQSDESRSKTVSLLADLLGESRHKLPPHAKSKVLVAIQSFLNEADLNLDEPLRAKLWILVSSLFAFFKDDHNRQVLCEVLGPLSRYQERLSQAVECTRAMNAVSSQKLDEIDYDTRLQAIQSLNTLPIDQDDVSMWLPIVHNLVYFTKTTEDFSIRSNAVSCLRQFITKACAESSSASTQLTMDVVLPAIKQGLKHESELMRADFVALLGLLLQHLPAEAGLVDLQPLLVGNDEEASFFTNVLHIQQHRRLRAIRRLLAEVEKGFISAKNITELFIPLLEMFIHDSQNDDSDQSTKGQSIAAMAVLLQWVDWKHFKSFFHRYKSDLGSSKRPQKETAKLMGHAADALLSVFDRRETIEGQLRMTEAQLARSIGGKAVLQTELKSHFIPRLAELIHYKDEAEMSFRVPLAITAVKLTKLLPAEELSAAAGPIILDISQILRSKTQESRDFARHALSQIVVLLGPSSLKFVLLELRTALTKGSQLHVLSYTLHSILVTLAPNLVIGELDYCCEDIVAVIIDDTFGAIGQEKDNENYVSDMKEVKGKKSFDSMELLAKSTSMPALQKVVAPLQTILIGNLGIRKTRQLDELLRRVGVGLSRNPAASQRDLLVFAYQLIQALYQQRAVVEPRKLTLDEKNRERYLVQLSTANKATAGRSSPLLYKLARFGLDLVRSAFQRHDELLTAENVHGFLPIIGDALVEGQEDVQISALRLLSAVIKLPMPELEQNAPVYVLQAVKIVQGSTNTNEEAAQAALKLVASVLRECKGVTIRDSDIATLLHRVTPDMEEPDRQGVTFNFIRAVMARRIQLPEVYDLVDKIGVMMVTNHTRSARDVARGVYVHFLVEYPQSTARWSKQQKFLLKNLEYDYPEGRSSVLEAINTLIVKMKGTPGHDLRSAFYLPILVRMANDDNKSCRELAGALLGQMFSRASPDQLKEFLEPLRSWVEQSSQEELQRVGLQTYSVLFESEVDVATSDVEFVRDTISQILQHANVGDDWELRFQAMILISKMVRSHPQVVMISTQRKMWACVWLLLRDANAWIQSTAARVVGEVFRDCLSADVSKLPLSSSHGLSLDPKSLVTILKSSVSAMKRLRGDVELGAQTVANLVFLAKCMSLNGLTVEIADQGTAQDDDSADDSVDDDKDIDAMNTPVKSISAMQYLFDQMARVLRRETTKLTAAALTPKLSALQLLTAIIPSVPANCIGQATIRSVLLPLQHLTDTHVMAPRAADSGFSAAHQRLIEQGHEVMEVIQHRIGDAEYVKALADVGKMVRQRREERRTKRRIERVADPEKAAQDKRRKGDRKKERKREIGKVHQNRRREIGI